MWSSYNIRKAKKGKNITMDEAKFIMSVIMITVKLSSMQRPGAVTNCLINEYKEAIIERGVKVIKVVN